MRGRGTDTDSTRVGLVEPGPLLRNLRRLLFVASDPLNLAVLRIAVFGAILLFLPHVHAAQLASFPEALVKVPAGAGWLAALPRSVTLVTWAGWLLAGACVLAVIGWRTRLAAVTATVLSLYVLGIPQLYGKVDHYHHLVWLAALLALSPCGDALSFDARRRPRTAPSVRYGLPIRVAWLLIGVCYFLPGLAKAVSPHWYQPQNAQKLLDVQRWAAGLPQMDVPDALLIAAAVATVVLEVGFVFLVFSRSRPWVVAMALAFHVSTLVLMEIFFWTLILGYVAFFDWSALVRRWRRAAGPAPPAASDDSPGSLRQTAYAGLVAVVVMAGAAIGVDGWPFASYPTFATKYGPPIDAIEVIVRTADGRELPVELFERAPASRRAAMMRNALSRPQALPMVVEDTVLPAGTTEVAVYHVTIDARRQEVIGRALLWERSVR